MHTNQLEVALSAAPRAIEIVPSLCCRPVTDVRSSAIGGSPCFALRLAHARLNHLDLHLVGRLIAHRHRAMKLAGVVGARVDVLQEVRGGIRRFRGVDFEDDVAHLGLDEHFHRRARPGLSGGEDRQREDEGDDSDRLCETCET